MTDITKRVGDEHHARTDEGGDGNGEYRS